jgi:DNA glycosylase AlkZ-like
VRRSPRQTTGGTIGFIPSKVLTLRELNRALLARQLLLARERLPVERAVERLGALQAQYSPSPSLQLWTRLEGFEREELTRALERRRLVKALLMRGTLHIVTAADYWAYARARKDIGPVWPRRFDQLLPQATLEELVAATTSQLRERRSTLREILTALSKEARGPATASFLWRTMQRQGYYVHVPPSGTWGYHKDGHYAAAQAWLDGEPPDADAALDHLVRRYLHAFGPATKHDVAQWAGIPRLRPIVDSLRRLDVRTFRDEEGRVLYDLPRAPLPDADTPAPPRLVPRYDNLVLSHADRRRILGDVPVSRVITKNALVHATILVDGLVRGTWRIENGRVVVEPFRGLSAHTREALEAEKARVEQFLTG